MTEKNKKISKVTPLKIAIVKKGETLTDIARRSGSPVNFIAKRNHLQSANKIHPGQVLIVDSRLLTRVKHKDTVEKVARRTNKDVSYLCSLNGINRSKILSPGSYLILEDFRGVGE
jgi:LysM repeat protein